MRTCVKIIFIFTIYAQWQFKAKHCTHQFSNINIKTWFQSKSSTCEGHKFRDDWLTLKWMQLCTVKFSVESVSACLKDTMQWGLLRQIHEQCPTDTPHDNIKTSVSDSHQSVSFRLDGGMMVYVWWYSWRQCVLSPQHLFFVSFKGHLFHSLLLLLTLLRLSVSPGPSSSLRAEVRGQPPPSSPSSAASACAFKLFIDEMRLRSTASGCKGWNHLKPHTHTHT